MGLEEPISEKDFANHKACAPFADAVGGEGVGACCPSVGPQPLHPGPALWP